MASGKGKDLLEKGYFQSKGVKVLSKAHIGESEHVAQMIEQVFPNLLNKSDVAGAGEPVDLARLSHYIDCSLNEAMQNTQGSTTDPGGRLGPETVEFDYTGSFGTLVVEADRLGVSSHSNFSTIRSNTCVYKGKWIYELLLGSKGVMQVGWCTVKCKFTEEDGAGDTKNSFAFDGSRVQKWNMKMHSKYGEGWLAGDIISCAIDCDNGVVSFMRNGCTMGDAFTEVPLGPGHAYFGAVSLSHNENLRANFGSTPLRYPLEGYRPLQDPPATDVIKARVLFTYMDRLLPLLTTARHGQQTNKLVDRERGHRSQKATLLILGAHIVGNLAPLLKNSYVVEECLLKVLLDMRENQECINSLLNLFFSILQEQELKPCMDNLIISLLSNYRFSPVLENFVWQKKYLVLLHALLLHVPMRKYLLKNVLFDRVKFPIFLHVKPPDDKVLACMIPRVWYKRASKDESEDVAEDSKELSEEEKEDKSRFDASCDVLRANIRDLEEIQTNIVKLLLTRDDCTDQDAASSRQIFQLKFREFLKENIIPPHIKIQQINHCPPLVQLCFFNRLLRALQYHLDRDLQLSEKKLLSSNEIYVPSGTFCNGSLDYFDCQRLGGLLSHLKKTCSEVEIKSNLSKISADETLVEILDGLFMLYNTAAHKQLGKMCSIRETFQEYIVALTDVEKKIAVCPVELVDVMAELKRARSVFLEKVVEQARHMAWIICVIYSADKQADVHWLMMTILRTLDQASADGQLFGFVPDYYIEACINTYNALTGYFDPVIPYTRIQGHENSLAQYAVFLSNNFSDRRIVNSDIQDTLIQALACFVCYPRSLHALESMPEDNCMQMTKTLLAPYEGRSWAQTNWILLRLWKGCGFAYRYRHLPHLKPVKNQENEHTSASLQKPCPSEVFQQYIQRILSSDEEGAIKLLDTILNQLNWAFSEFISMLQELHQFYTQSSFLLVDSRRLKICATCFDISVGLLRVLEMIIHLNPELFVDFVRPNSELLLRRLFQLLTQVLNRVTCKSNTFEIVVTLSIPGLDAVDHFPILASVTGILIELVVRSKGLSQERAIAALMAEPGFQLSSIEFLLGDSEASTASDEETFSLTDYKEVSAEEEQQVEQLLSVLRGQVQLTPRQDIEEDMVCNICYAHTKTVKFLPCLHQSCRSCITQHLMNKNECFFCKMPVTKVVDIEDDV